LFKISSYNLRLFIVENNLTIEKVPSKLFVALIYKYQAEVVILPKVAKFCRLIVMFFPLMNKS